MKDLSWRILALSLVIFVVGIVWGWTIALYEMFPELLGVINELLSGVTPIPPLTLLVLLLINNITKSFTFMVLGVALIIPSIVFILSNALMLGIAGFLIIGTKGALYFLIKIFPHGIFEFPALILSGALGIKLGLEVIKGFIRKDVSLEKTFKLCVRNYILVVLPLLVLAALVEVFITPALLNLFFS